MFFHGASQVNAIRGVMPFSDHCYGVGFFGSASFFNHACQPNAVMIVQPNSVYIHTLAPIAVGEEITVAYQELPLELLSPNAVRVLHMRSGAIVNQLGCRCKICRIHLDDEAEALEEAGQDPEQGREVAVNLESTFTEATAERLKLDERLRIYVSVMMNGKDSEDAMHASNGMRMYYEHYLTPPPPGEEDEQKEGPKDGEERGEDGDADPEEKPAPLPPSFCADLAYQLADVYCRNIIHYPDQDKDNYLFWTALYHDLLRRTAITMPKTLTDALGARCYVALLIAARLDREDKESQRRAFDVFLEAWLLLRAAHGTMYGTVAFTSLVCAAYPNIGEVVIRNERLIAHKEMEFQLRAAQAHAAEAQAQADRMADEKAQHEAAIAEAVAQREQSSAVEAMSQSGAPPSAKTDEEYAAYFDAMLEASRTQVMAAFTGKEYPGPSPPLEPDTAEPANDIIIIDETANWMDTLTDVQSIPPLSSSDIEQKTEK
jgi:hypothetical protein